MSSDNSKPPSKPAAAGSDKAPTKDAATDAKSTGRVKFDDRGNAIWEWSITTGAFGREVTTQRLRKLEHPALSIADDTPPTPLDTVHANPQGTKKGYDPYDSGKLGKAKAPPPRETDLRKLGEWLKSKKPSGGKKDE